MEIEPTELDVITLGETMVRFTPPGLQRFGQSSMTEMHVGGSESNTAVGLARLGHKVAWVSRLTRNPIGQWIANTIAGQGVDTSHLVWTDQDRVGTYFLEQGQPPRTSQVYYDRAGSAMSRMLPEDLPADLFREGRSKILHLSGITVGISEQAAQTAWEAVRFASEAGWTISFDLNYRAKLWSPAEAFAACMPFMHAADYVFLPMRDAKRVLGLQDATVEQSCIGLHQQFENATLILTMGSNGAAAVLPSAETFLQPAYPTTEVERLGGGDAFSAGFLSGILQELDVAACLRWGAAAAAMKYTIPGDLPLFDREVVRALAESTESGIANSGIDR